jgi:predicted GNAT family acetyltransferase
MADPTKLTITNNVAAQRYEAAVEREVAYLEYRIEPGRIVLIHTQVPPSLEGHGVGRALAHAALEDARAHHLLVIPRCPFVASYIRRHQEYLPLVAPEDRERVTRR